MIDFEDLLNAFEFVSSGQPTEHEAFLCVKTGKIYWHSEYGDNEEPLPDDIDEPGRYIAIPHKNELDLGKSLALKFTRETLPEAVGKVQAVFSRAGAYARFKDLLERRGLQQQWYRYEERATEQALWRWGGDNGIEVAAGPSAGLHRKESSSARGGAGNSR